jgi:hypothetical protein
MRAVLRFVPVLVALLVATSAAAQQPGDLALAAAELRRATSLLDSVAGFFRKDGKNGTLAVNPDERSESFRSLRKAAEIFEHFSSKSDRDDLLDSIRSFFAEKRLPTPSTIVDAVDEAEKSSDRHLPGLVWIVLGASLNGARDDIEAEIKFGPIVDNPQLYKEITPPRNGIGLLRNLKFALDHDSLLRRDFYTPENLERFFAHQPIIHREPDGSIWARWVVKPTAAALAKMKPGTERYTQCQYVVGLRPTDLGRKKAGIGISCNFEHALSPVLDDVERVFGREWKDTWMPPLHGLPRPRTSIDGNTRMTYTLDSASVTRSLEVTFDFDGTFDWLRLNEEEK